jgi:hypothetical protein
MLGSASRRAAVPRSGAVRNLQPLIGLDFGCELYFETEPQDSFLVVFCCRLRGLVQTGQKLPLLLHGQQVEYSPQSDKQDFLLAFQMQACPG